MARQPDVNIMRVAFQALSAVLGGTQSLHTNSRDEAMALPSDSSVLIALRTQQVIGYEIGVADTVDSLGGGIIPDEDIPALKEAGIVEIFTPGTNTVTVAEFIKEKIGRS